MTHTGVPFEIRRARYLRSQTLENLRALRRMEDHRLDREPDAMARRSYAELNAEIARRIPIQPVMSFIDALRIVYDLAEGCSLCWDECEGRPELEDEFERQERALNIVWENLRGNGA